jgi:cell division protein FtsB
MTFSIGVTQKVRQHWLALLSCFLVVYFGFHSFCGERNIYRYFALKKEIAEQQALAKQFDKKKQNLQRKVSHLSDISLDTDLLDERARVVLNMAADDEFVILDQDIN